MTVAGTEGNEPLRLSVIAVIILLLRIVYTTIHTFALGGILSAGLDLIPGIAGIIVLARCCFDGTGSLLHSVASSPLVCPPVQIF